MPGNVSKSELNVQAHEYQLREFYRVTMAQGVLQNDHGPAIWGSHFHDKGIPVYCDNSSVVQIMNKSSSRGKSMMVLICSLVFRDETQI